MNVKQISTILQSITDEVIGDSVVVQEDLSNIVDVGRQILDNTSVDNYVKSLVNRIGRTEFVDRVLASTAPAITMDSWEFGSVLQKVRCELPDTTANPTWQLTKGQSVDPFIYNPPEVSVKYFNSKTTFEIDISFTELQVKESLKSASEFMRFIAMIENRIRTKLTLCRDNLIMRTIVNLIAEKIAANQGVVNLLTGYNEAFGTSLTADKAIKNPDFLRFASATIKLYSDRLKTASVLYNTDGYVTFTPKEYQHLVLLSEFATGLDVYLYSDTYHEDLLKLGSFDTVAFWQGTGNSVAPNFSAASSINAIVASDGETVVNTNGVIGVLFDRDACAVCNDNPRVTSIYNPRGEYSNYFYKEDCSYINDLAENVVVFVVH